MKPGIACAFLLAAAAAHAGELRAAEGDAGELEHRHGACQHAARVAAQVGRKRSVVRTGDAVDVADVAQEELRARQGAELEGHRVVRLVILPPADVADEALVV